MKRSIKIITILLLVLFMTACSQSPATHDTASNGPAWAPAVSPLPQETVVKVGMKQVVSDAGILIGTAKNYYKDLGIKIEPVQFNTGQEMINQLAAGQLDVGATVTSSGLFNAMSRDIPIKIVADKGINLPGQGYYRLVIRKDLTDTIKDYKDLRNKKIAIVGTASLDEIALSRVLQKGALTTNDVDIQVIRSFPDMLVSFGNKSIDAAMIIEPFVTLSINKDLADPWKDPVDYDPDAQTALLVYGTSMTKNPAVANRFMTAYIQSLRDYNDGFVKNKNRTEIIDILCKYSVIKDPALYEKMFPTGLNPNGYVRTKGILLDLDWYKENNLLQSDIKYEDAVDNQYVDFAVKTLGTYQ
ncbi:MULTISPECIES: ABC transporter substrate-binding protein [Pelosinus]|uniref:Extracellular solute-binding protein family 3 n=1 Tax=Pelosinus fermentans B4 TaxID=1149862 RepID=I9LC49_9FIRM|nr:MULTISPECIES: ABC transporter substrate-binding protein [Pelosinus]EIW17896.1 extracellular solute-binding protein family 3 [Pelosinus fermentans B4]EIW23858.1 extracellular solute-binding protein family 3 [Pelosinus fermentans A11]OAM94781.1 family 3 extracellular solute-binding protein [Pelosinus fermentans DSM 17108]SDR17414.1 NitT/TauT family transport system substrate-binding protein [Pelosinus fermentans]